MRCPAGPPDRYVAEHLARTTDGDVTAFTVTTWYGPNAPESRALVEDLRDPASALAPPAGLDVLVGGRRGRGRGRGRPHRGGLPAHGAVHRAHDLPVLFLLLRSVVLPAKALVMNALSILASFGALVWIFQDGNLSALLGFAPLGFVETTLPVILFCVALRAVDGLRGLPAQPDEGGLGPHAATTATRSRAAWSAAAGS